MTTDDRHTPAPELRFTRAPKSDLSMSLVWEQQYRTDKAALDQIAVLRIDDSEPHVSRFGMWSCFRNFAEILWAMHASSHHLFVSPSDDYIEGWIDQARTALLSDKPPTNVFVPNTQGTEPFCPAPFHHWLNCELGPKDRPALERLCAAADTGKGFFHRISAALLVPDHFAPGIVSERPDAHSFKWLAETGSVSLSFAQDHDLAWLAGTHQAVFDAAHRIAGALPDLVVLDLDD